MKVGDEVLCVISEGSREASGVVKKPSVAVSGVAIWCALNLPLGEAVCGIIGSLSSTGCSGSFLGSPHPMTLGKLFSLPGPLRCLTYY